VNMAKTVIDAAPGLPGRGDVRVEHPYLAPREYTGGGCARARLPRFGPPYGGLMVAIHRGLMAVLCVLAGAAIAGGAAPAPASAPEALRAGERIERLDNGLRVIVKERHLGGVAAFRIYVAAGALNEGEYSGTGISHLLEHVVSGGATPTRSEEQIRDALAAIGAQTNAHTSKQFVCYHGETSATTSAALSRSSATTWPTA